MQQVHYYNPGSEVALDNKWKIRRAHTVEIAGDKFMSKIRWAKSTRNMRASLSYVRACGVFAKLLDDEVYVLDGC